MRIDWPWTKQPKSKIVWIDLGDLGDLVHPDGPHEQWQDHGLGLLRTILHQNGIETDIVSTRAVTSWEQLRKQLVGYEMAMMNVRSYTFPPGHKAAQIFKEVNPHGIVLAGGMHATVAPDEMLEIATFDHICQGPGEKVIVDLVRDPGAFPRLIQGESATSMAEWPMIDRTLWPKPASRQTVRRFKWHWPMEPECGWGPGPVATIITSRVCPWQCVFCNENSYIPNMGRKPVDAVIDELNFLDRKYGVGSVVIHDSMFFQNPSWLREWIEKYPRKANKVWPYWAAGRSDTVRQWPDLFEALLRETNWNLISIGFESGSDRVLRLLNKECTEEDNYFTIDLVNRIGDEMAARGQGSAEVLVQHHARHPRRDARGRVQDDADDQADEAALPVDLVLRALSRLSARLPAHRRGQEPDVEGQLPSLPRRRKGEGRGLQVLPRSAGRQIRCRGQSGSERGRARAAGLSGAVWTAGAW